LLSLPHNFRDQFEKSIDDGVHNNIFDSQDDMFCLLMEYDNVHI